VGRPTLSINDILALGQRSEEGCLLWPRTTNGLGYGRVKVQGKTWVVHRYVWTKLRGEIPDGMTLDHLCHNEAAARGDCLVPEGECIHRRCYELEHLALKTQRENWLAGRQGFPAMARLRTHCKRGHPYEGDNLVVAKDGSRVCRECVNLLSRERREKERALRPPKPPRTHCVNGHPWTEKNVATYANGKSRCLVCHRLDTRRRRGLL
jgi:hypothetical protein